MNVMQSKGFAIFVAALLAAAGCRKAPVNYGSSETIQMGARGAGTHPAPAVTIAATSNKSVTAQANAAAVEVRSAGTGHSRRLAGAH